MAPPPEYDKEPKAPDKSATTVTNEEIKVHTLVNDLPTFSDLRTANPASNNEVENNKHVESLDDGQLRALLDEAIQYKCPKDREGKSSLFKELLEEVEHQDEVSEAASRGFIARGGPHANSLQDLMAALKAESTSRPVRHQPPPHSQTSVSARAIHGGSLPSGVDTSFLLAEEPTRGGYLATVRCVNPPPLAERRVSASDANSPAEMELLNKSKPMFPMYTARASLEIGSGSVCSGRAVTTTTPSNQVRKTTPSHPASRHKRFHHNRTLNHHQVEPRPIHWSTTRGPPGRIYTPKSLYRPDKPTDKQKKLLSALRPKCSDGINDDINIDVRRPPGPNYTNTVQVVQDTKKNSETFAYAVENWYNALNPTFADVKSSVKNNMDGADLTPRIPDDSNTSRLRRKPIEDTESSSLLVDIANCGKALQNVDVGINRLRGTHDANTAKVSPLHSKSEKNGKKGNKCSNNSNINVRSTMPRDSGEKDTTRVSRVGAKCVGKDDSVVAFGDATLRNPKDEDIVIAPHHSEYTTKTEQKIGKYANTVDNWYKGLTHYTAPTNANNTIIKTTVKIEEIKDFSRENRDYADINPNIGILDIAEDIDVYNPFASKFETNSSTEETIYHSVNVSSNVRYKQDEKCDIREYRKRVGKIVRASINPRNVRSMTIGKPEPMLFNQDIIKSDITNNKSKNPDTKESKEKVEHKSVIKTSHKMKSSKLSPINESQITDSHGENTHTKCELKNKLIVSREITSEIKNNVTINENKEVEMRSVTESDSDHKDFEMNDMAKDCSDKNQIEMKDMSKPQNKESGDIEMNVISSTKEKGRDVDSFSKFLSNQQNLFKSLESANSNSEVMIPVATDTNNNAEKTKGTIQNFREDSVLENSNSEGVKPLKSILITNSQPQVPECLVLEPETNKALTQICTIEDTKRGEQYVLAELSNNAYIFLTFPKSLSTPQGQASVQLQELQDDSSSRQVPGESSALINTKNNEKVAVGSSESMKMKINKNSLRELLLESLLKRDGAERGQGGATAAAGTEVDSTIPFSCITTPEVVASCNTTSSTVQPAVAVDPKPLQLGSCYRAVASLTGALPPPPAARAPPARREQQPRSVMSSTFNGLPLARGYGAAGGADDYKKSLDENGNAVQGIGSPVSGSSQHKKPRRKKSSKNETVIKSHQIDGYQGNKDLNEVLRFIESNADAGRQGKLRGKHKDDDDKGKKRSAERRKDKEKVKRASSLEELSRTKLEDLTDAPEPPPAKPERRSWGDDARDAFYFRASEPEPAPAPDADFQTVTKRRKPRRRDTERDERAERDARRARLPEPRARRESAPPSDRSNDSNDDMDSVHSLPAPPRAPLLTPAPPPHASYADIARTRHNIPDLIESCNFYAEGEGGGDTRRAEPAPVAGDADGYPALEPRATVVRRGVAKPPPPTTAPRRDRKERAPTAPPDCPAPDVVADRRPPVILLDSAARPRDMDGVTFGFDINEQLLGGPARRPRCDLVRDAPDAETVVPDGEPAPAEAGAVAPLPAALPAAVAGVVAVVAGCAALRYVPPDPPPDTHHLHQIIDYVGAAWEDVIRCGAGKVRYFSE